MTLNQSEFSAEFCIHPQFSAIFAKIESSPTLVAELNGFPGEIVLSNGRRGFFFSFGQ